MRLPLDTCNSSDHRSSRRRFLQAITGSAAFLAAARRGDAQIVSAGGRVRSTARACIFINLVGAPSHLDTFDPKDGPWNPEDADLRQYSGGIVLSRTMFPTLSQMTNDICLLHSVKSWEAAHDRGQFYVQTSHPANPAFLAETPHIGSVIGLERGGAGPMPPFMALNLGGTTFQGSKFLGGTVEPFAAPANQGGLATLEHGFYGAQSQQRFQERYDLLQELDGGLRTRPYDTVMSDHSDYYSAARRLMYDPAISSVFRFSVDDNGRYGNTNFGRSCIVARNALQAKNGTSFVSVLATGWDTHQSMFDRRYTPNMYQLNGDLDRGVGTLATDLKLSGDFDRTLIVIMGEFGRTPGELNVRGGRDHNRDAMSVLMMGGGIRGGRVIGATDAQGAAVVTPGWSQDRPILMEDIAATIYSALGIDWTKAIADTPSGRKFEYVPLAATGQYVPVEEVFG